MPRDIPQTIRPEYMVAGLLMFIENKMSHEDWGTDDEMWEYWKTEQATNGEVYAEHGDLWPLDYVKLIMDWAGQPHEVEGGECPDTCDTCTSDEYIRRAYVFIHHAQKHHDKENG